MTNYVVAVCNSYFQRTKVEMKLVTAESAVQAAIQVLKETESLEEWDFEGTLNLEELKNRLYDWSYYRVEVLELPAQQ